MPLRLSGLASGMDTESIVTELMNAQRLKSTKIENKITKLEWTQDKWKELNSKIYKFYTGSLSKLRLQGSYSTKRATSSNENKVEVQAGTTAPAGTHTIKVEKLASAQFITGAMLSTDDNGKAISLNTKLTDLGFDASEGTTINIKTASTEVNLDIGSSTTVGDFTNALKKAGINAVYDVNQKRFFISSKESGITNAFSITTTSTEKAQDRNAIRDFMDYGTLSAANKDTVDKALAAYINPLSTAADITNARKSLLTVTHSQVRKDYISSYIADPVKIAEATEIERTRLEASLPEGGTLDEKVLKAAVDTKLKRDAEASATTQYELWKGGTAPVDNVFKAAETDLDKLITDYTTDSGKVITQTNSLTTLGLSEIIATTNADQTVSISADPSVKYIAPSNSSIVYNGVTLTGTSNVITANGLTFTLKGVTVTPEPNDNEDISLTITNDTQAVYDMIKDFVKNYNELLTEMNEAYNATSSKGFEPLTDEQKDSMSESQIDKWENKIKDALLRRDTTLNTLMSTLRTDMSKQVVVDNKKYSLMSFGIGSVNYTEKGLLHIYGDEDDSLSAGRDNDLMEALNQDPDKVMKVLTNIAGELYDNLADKMSSTTLRSALTFYNDKEITKEITAHKEDLKTLEGRLKKMEDRYYKQFSAMESAMAKLNSQSSSLASMLGMNQK